MNNTNKIIIAIIIFLFLLSCALYQYFAIKEKKNIENYDIKIKKKNKAKLNIIFFKKNLKIKKSKNEAKLNLYNILKIYLNNVSEYEILTKTGQNIKKNDLAKFYIDNILDFTSKEKKILRYYVKYINKVCEKYNKISDNWNFIKISSIIDKGMPFTLDKYVFLSDKYLKKMLISKTLKKEFLDTLIHEKIHIIQRFNQNLFNEFYINNLNIIYSKKLQITDYWKKRHYKNPDGLDIKWIYKNDNTYYLPLLIMNDNNKNILEEVVIKLDNNLKTTKNYMNLREFILFKDIPNNISSYHPNELVAYIIPKIILNSYLPDKIKNQYKNLLNYLV